ncbi:3'-5' exonuclease [Psychrobacter sanguinis]|uniref:DNA 3'-5' helicase II n=1 Tax=Psychrobacter sanguinis TaxID=861445 RepID=A0A844M2Z9_9GAMM|nr:AAA family ATPase [Psychrobacter sanguinis]MUG33319.1 DUF2075 domain-containing protein [Psychrobacter sanguinis]
MAYYFTLPKYTELSPEQQFAVDQTESLALSGGPGTGKSVVCIWRHLRNYETKSKKSLLLTYTKTLEHYLESSAGEKNPEAKGKVDRVYKWSLGKSEKNILEEYDEIIIDEAQDIPTDTLQKIIGYAKTLSYGADKRQSLYLDDERLHQLYTEFACNPKTANNHAVNLTKNYRNSREVLEFIRSAFRDAVIPKNVLDDAKVTGRKPIVHRMLAVNARSAKERVKMQIADIAKIVNHFYSPTHNIAIFVPYADQIDKYYYGLKEILAKDIGVSRYYNTLKNIEGMDDVHITTFKSSKGTEFDTVIIPEFDYACARDNISQSEFYVAFTRAKLNLFLLCNGEFPPYFDVNTVLIEE